MFYGCKSIASIPDISKWDTSKIVDMSFMFYNCLMLSSLPDIDNWSIENLKSYTYMFVGCSSLKNFPDFAKKIKESFNLSDKSNLNKEKKNNENNKNLNKDNTNNKKKENKYIKKDYENNFFLLCPKCKNIPYLLLKNKETIFLSCINCGYGQEESIEKIINGISEWSKKLIYYCQKHNDKIPAKAFCKEFEQLLCEKCLKIQEKNQINHTLIKITNLFVNFCDIHFNQKLNYYCKNCECEICEKCKNSHKNHVIKEINFESSEILDSNIITNIIEKAKNDNLYFIVQETIEKMQNQNSLDNSLDFNKAKKYIMKLFHDDIKIKHNLIYFIKILYFSSHKISKNRFEIIEKYKEIINIIKDYDIW